MKHILTVLYSLLFIAFTGCTTITVTEEFFLKPETPISSIRDYLAPGYSIDEQYIKTSDNEKIFSVFLFHPEAKTTVIYFGGNGFKINRKGAEVAKHLAKQKINILLTDYRGFGNSTGTPTIKKLYEDSLEIYEYVKSMKKTHNTNLVIYGFSMGSFPATYAASKKSPGGLILEAGATSAKAWVKESIPWIIRLFIRFKYDEAIAKVNNLEIIENVRVPVLFAVGKDDDVLPPKLSKKLYKAAGTDDSLKEFHILKGLEHGGLIKTDQYKEILAGFLKKIESGS